MSKIIEFKNTNFGYDSTNAFNDFNMEIESGDIVTLIGPSGSGKTTLLKMLCNKLPNDTIFYEGLNIKQCDINELKREIVVVFDLPFKTNNLKSELGYFLKTIQIPTEDINERVDRLIAIFELGRIADCELNKLSTTDAYLIKILRFLIIEPKFFAIDDIFTNITPTNKKKIINFIKTNSITFLNITTDLNDALLGNKLFVLENFVLILEGSTLSVLKTDTLLKRLGFSLPLPVDLSIELNHYDILNKIYTDKQKLVNELWK